MVSKEEAKRFLSKINPFVEKLPDISDKISKLSDDKEFQNLLGRLGTIGGLFSIGLYLFDKTLENVSDTEKTYYSLINRTALSVAENIIKEANEIIVDGQNNEDILKQMMEIYSFKETDKEEYKKWNGLAVDHPIVKHFREYVIKFLEDNNLLASRYFNFATEFNSRFKEEVKSNPTFLKYQKQRIQKNLSQKKLTYLQWLLKNIDKPNPIDGGRKVSDYYVQNRAIEFYLDDVHSQTKDYWNISDYEAEVEFKKQKKWTIDDFLSSEDEDIVKYIAAPFGTGKTSFAKYTVIRIVNEYLSGQNTWIPIYVPLKHKLASFYRDGVEIYHDLRDIIKPEDEKILLVCDGLDEYPEPDGILSLKKDLLDIPSNYSISDLKIIFTTRLEAGFPQTLEIKRYIRLLPFTSDQVTLFFKKYGHENLTFENIKKYGIHEKGVTSLYKFDIIKPLFCWMFAISYPDLQITKKDIDIGKARLVLYSTFIHSISKGKYNYSKEIANEKWIMRKIAVLKTIYEDVYEEDLPQNLQTFIEEEQQGIIDLQNLKLHNVLASYFKLNEKNNNKHSVEFLHKSFQEYSLAEYYIESVLYDKGFRLNIGHPSDVTVEFLSSLLSIIKDVDKKKYEKPILRIFKSIYPNKSDKTDEEIVQLIKNIKETILDKAVNIFENNSIIHIDIQNRTKSSEFWIENVNSGDNPLSGLWIHRWIALFIINNLNLDKTKKLNKNHLSDLIRSTSHLIPFNIKYFQETDLSGLDLYGVDLYRSDLSGANLSRANLSRANLSRANLSGCNLQEANLSGANLFGTDFNKANIRGIDLYKADISGNSNLSEINLDETNSKEDKISLKFIKADLSGANLSRANLSKSLIVDSELSSAILKSTNLCDSVLINIHNFKYCQIDGETDFTNAITDKIEFIDYLEREGISKDKSPKIAKDKKHLKEELQEKRYPIEVIEWIINTSNLPQ